MTVWCWVEDLSTRHRYDITLSRLDQLESEGAVREIPGRRRRAPGPRRSKHFRSLAGLRSTRKRPAIMPAEDTEE